MSDNEHQQLIDKINRKIKMNQSKIDRLRTQYGIGLDPESAFKQRLLMLAQQIDDELKPGVPAAVTLETVIEQILGPITDDDASPERLQFELEWQEFVARSLEHAHSTYLAKRREATKPRLILPKNNGKMGPSSHE